MSKIVKVEQNLADIWPQEKRMFPKENWNYGRFHTLEQNVSNRGGGGDVGGCDGDYDGGGGNGGCSIDAALIVVSVVVVVKNVVMEVVRAVMVVGRVFVLW